MIYYRSLLGLIAIKASDKGITHIDFVNTPSQPTKEVLVANELEQEAAKQLDAYFKGCLKQFDLPLDLVGTSFQLIVWYQLCQIPYGETISYKILADRVGTKGFQAVGSANGRNPVAIVVPCHRVINHSGALGGYAGGIEKKYKLLYEIEGISLDTGGGGELC